MLIRFLPPIALLGTLLAFQGSPHHLPPALKAKNCNSSRSKDELPNDRFARKGGRETKVSVRYDKDLLTVDGVEQGRELNRYERLDLSNPKRMFAYEMDAAQIFVSARSFIWEHWHNQKPAYLTITASTVDATGTSHIFIEQDETGRWRVAWRIVRDHGSIADLPTYYAVQWVRPAGWDQP